MNAIPQDIYKDKAEKAVKRWEKLLNFESATIPAIQNERVRKTTALCMQNQAEYLMNESSNNSQGIFGATSQGNSVGGNGDNYATGDARLPKILIPMIRRTFPELISHEICGVQPMGGPVGLAFAMRYAYQSDLLSDVDAVGKPGATGGSPNLGYTGSASLATPPLTAEVGHNLLDTRFTGVENPQLSGHAEWLFANQDRGVAQLLESYEATGRVPQIEMKFEKTSVDAGTRRLATKWSIELEQDIKVMQGIDIDSEFTNTMSYELQAEIDREVVMRMVQSAFLAGYGAGFSIWSPVSADARWAGERNVTFYQKLLVESGRMAARNRRGSANFVIATPRVCTMLEMLPDFKTFEIVGTVNTGSVGISKVGVVGSRWTVYRDLRTEVQNESLYGNVGYTPTRTDSVEYALLGYKGAEYYDTGIIFCPYIPIMVQRAIDPNNFTPRVGLMTRYGIVTNIFGSSLYYHLVIVKGLGVAFTPGSVSVYL